MDVKSDAPNISKNRPFGKYFLLFLVLLFGISLVGAALFAPQITGFIAVIVFFIGISQVEYVTKYIIKDN